MHIDLIKLFGVTGGIIAMLIVLILVIIFGPLLFIWALNTLFPALAIPYTIETWSAVVIIDFFMRQTKLIQKRNKHESLSK